MRLNFSYTMMQKVKNDQKLNSRGPALIRPAGGVNHSHSDLVQWNWRAVSQKALRWIEGSILQSGRFVNLRTRHRKEWRPLARSNTNSCYNSDLPLQKKVARNFFLMRNSWVFMRNSWVFMRNSWVLMRAHEDFEILMSSFHEEFCSWLFSDCSWVLRNAHESWRIAHVLVSFEGLPMSSHESSTPHREVMVTCDAP